MSQGRVVVDMGGCGKKEPKEYNAHYKMSVERLPLVFGVSGYHVPNACGEAESVTTNYHDIQSMYVGNIQKIKYLEEHSFKYYLGGAINIPKLKDAYESYMKYKWDFNDQTSLIEH